MEKRRIFISVVVTGRESELGLNMIMDSVQLQQQKEQVQVDSLERRLQFQSTRTMSSSHEQRFGWPVK